MRDDDDTVPQGPRDEVFAARALAADVAHGDTIMRTGAAVVQRIDAPRVPESLRPRHRIRIAGEVIELDRPVLVGRSPREPRLPGGPRPVLVAVSSPERQISATHLEVREHGNAVVVTDLRTLNGSDVHRPGAHVVALRRGESLVVTAGARIDLGEGVVIDVLAPTGTEPQR